MHRSRIPAISLAAALGLAVLAVVGAPAASARGDDLQARATCSDGTTLTKVKVRPDRGGLRLDVWVKSAQVGSTWDVTATQGGTVVASGSRVARPDVPNSADDAPHAAEARFRARLGSTSLPVTVVSRSAGVTCTAVVGGA